MRGMASHLVHYYLEIRIYIFISNLSIGGTKNMTEVESGEK